MILLDTSIICQYNFDNIQLFENSTKGHAMIVTGLTSDGELQCKNSNRKDPTKINDNDLEIVQISLGQSENFSEEQWSIFNDDGYIDAYYLSIKLRMKCSVPES